MTTCVSRNGPVSAKLPTIPKSDDIVPTIRALNEKRRIAIDAVVQTNDKSRATFITIVKPIAELENIQSGRRALIAGLVYASPDVATQKAVEDAQNLPDSIRSEVRKRLDYLELVRAVEDGGECRDEGDAKLLAFFSHDVKKARCAQMDESSKVELAVNEQELSKICAEFNSKTRQQSIGTLYFTDKQLAGLSAEVLSTFSRLENGSISVQVKKKEMQIVLAHATDPATRKVMMLDWAHRLDFNESVFKRAVSLRHRQAQLYGYSSFAESVISDRMAESIDWVYSVLDHIAEKMIPAGAQYLSQLEAEKKKDLKDMSARMEPWDVMYYANKVEAGSAIDQDELSQYFPAKQTFQALLELFASYLGLKFSKLPREQVKPHVWADDVDVWTVWDRSPDSEEQFIGHLYVDIYGRQNKFKHNQAVNLQPSYLKADGTRVFPISTIMCNLGDIVKHSCRLLSHRQLQTLFHELGHCMHDLLSRTKYQHLHGYEVKMEFGEAIGTLLEKWIWMPDVLQTISCHYTYTDAIYAEEWLKVDEEKELPPKKLPDSLVSALLETRRQKRLSMHLQQLSETMFDLTVHHSIDGSSPAKLENVPLTETYEKLQKKYMGIERPEVGYLHTSFNHLMSGMEAGYYAYLLANIFAEEIFEESFSNGRHGDTTSWRRFRECLLLPGASRDEMQMIKDFLGRDPTPDALLKSLGLL